MKLSVIVPVYNMASEGKLSFCLDSLVHQTMRGRSDIPFLDYEIIAVDDASKDESPEILRQYEKQYPDRFHAYFSKENRHQGGAKNIGLAHAKGDWIAFIDADDWVVPDYFSSLLDKAKESGADCVGTDYNIVFQHTMTPGKLVANSRMEQTGIINEEKRRSLFLDFGSLCVKIYRREIIIGCESRFPEHIYYEDNAIAKTWVMRIHHFEYLPGPYYYYYQHDDSTVHTVSPRRLKDRMISARLMLKEAKNYGYDQEFLPELEYSFTVLFYKNTLFSAMQSLRKEEMKGEGSIYSFVTSLAKEMKETFPNFEKNRYYQERTAAEEKKLIAMQMKSPQMFYLYYRMLWLYRNIRYGKK